MAQTAIPNEVFTIWVPLAITLVLGFIGVLRGGLREAVVAASVVLGAFICTEWASPWAAEIKGVFPTLDQQQTQFILSLVIFWLILLALGYGLAGLLPRVPVNTPSRLVGGLLGLMSGAAAAGWSLRFSITNPDMTLQPGPFLDDPFSRGFMIWAGWFPIAIALLGTVAVIVGPIRRAQRTVAEPSPSTEWTPSTAATGAAPGAAGGYGAAAAGAGAAIYAAGGQSQPPVSSYGSPYGPVPPYAADSPPTAALPVRTASPLDTQYSSSPPASARVSSTDTGTYNNAEAATTPSWMLPPEPAKESPPPTPTPEEASKPSEPAPEPAASPAAENASAETSTESGSGQATCPNCGEPVVPGATFCTQCGARLASGSSG